MLSRPLMRQLQDSFGRQFSYLRLSVTDACNFRCSYCLPQGYEVPAGEEGGFLSVTEIRNLTSAFAQLGTWKVRITGGEPTLRRDLPQIIHEVSKTPGIRRVALSTNGNRLRQLLPELLDAGLGALNISVDSLDRKRFAELTGMDRLGEVLDGIELGLAGGIPVKVNSVLLRDESLGELEAFLDWIRDRPISVRFIELMPTAQNREFFDSHHVTAGTLRFELLKRGWKETTRNEGDGPAIEYSHPTHSGRIGIIAPYSSDFCKTCNRLRVTSRGRLRLCLFAEGEQPIRHLLQDASQLEELKSHLCSLLERKEVSHYLPEGRYGDNRTFSAMGG